MPFLKRHCKSLQIANKSSREQQRKGDDLPASIYPVLELQIFIAVENPEPHAHR